MSSASRRVVLGAPLTAVWMRLCNGVGRARGAEVGRGEVGRGEVGWRLCWATGLQSRARAQSRGLERHRRSMISMPLHLLE